MEFPTYFSNPWLLTGQEYNQFSPPAPMMSVNMNPFTQSSYNNNEFCYDVGTYGASGFQQLQQSQLLAATTPVLNSGSHLTDSTPCTSLLVEGGPITPYMIMPKPSMAYILETCVAGICAPTLREVPMDYGMLEAFFLQPGSAQLQEGHHQVSNFKPVLQMISGYTEPVSYPKEAVPSGEISQLGTNGRKFKQSSGVKFQKQVNQQPKKKTNGKRSKSIVASNQNNPKLKTVTDSATTKPQKDNGNEEREKKTITVARPESEGNRLACETVLVNPGNAVQERAQEKEAIKTSPLDLKYCKFCKSNGEPAFVYLNHVLKNEKNETVCPILRRYVCPTCQKTGSEAHTVRYCPETLDAVDIQRYNKIVYKKIRNSVGGIRVLKY